MIWDKNQERYEHPAPVLSATNIVYISVFSTILLMSFVIMCIKVASIGNYLYIILAIYVFCYILQCKKRITEHTQRQSFSGLRTLVSQW